MAKRVILHIGRAKTGSTAIQRALAENRPLLRELGFTYPGAARNHNHMIPDFPGDEAAAIRAEIDAAPGDAIVSSEGLQNIEAAIVREWLTGLDVRVVCYVRDQAEALASGWAQIVKAELETCTLEEYVARAGLVDYGAFLRPWRDAFSKDALRVRTYQADVVPDFLSVLGVRDHTPFLLEGDPNPSIGGELIETMRRINSQWRGSSTELRAEMYSSLRMLANANPAWRELYLPADLAERIREAHRECNKAFAREYLGRDEAFPDAQAHAL